MKRLIHLMFTILIVIMPMITYSYKGEHGSEIETYSGEEKSIAEVVISAGRNFEVYDITKGIHPEYRYVIYNLDGVTVENQTVWRTPPHITYTYNDTLLSIYRGGRIWIIHGTIL